MDLLIKNLNWDKKYTLYLTITPDMKASAESGFLDEKIKGVQAAELPPHGDLIERDKLPHYKMFSIIGSGVDVVDLEDIKNAPTVLEASIE